MDWQKMIMDIIGVVFMALIPFVWKVYLKPLLEDYVKPWLITHNLWEAAKIAVYAVETAYGRYHGDEKLEAALKQMQDKGWNIDSDVVKNAISAAWQELNITQIAAGVKDEPIAVEEIIEPVK